jgi:hypothetical protein
MNCEKTNGIDLGEFLLEREEPQWEEFRNHYPGCDDCSREVAGWSKFERVLQSAQIADPHPSEEMLHGLTMLSLAADERVAVENHLEGCAPCRSEVATLRRFDFSAVQAVVAAEQPSPSFIQQSVTSLAEWRESLSWSQLQPGLMAAALVLIAVPIGLSLWQQGEGTGAESPAGLEMAQEESPAVDETLPDPEMLAEAVVEEVIEEGEFPGAIAEGTAPPVQIAEDTGGLEQGAPEMKVAAHSSSADPSNSDPFNANPSNSSTQSAIPGSRSFLEENPSEVVEIAATVPRPGPGTMESGAAEQDEAPGLVLPEGETMLIAALLPGDLPIYGVEGLMALGGASVRTGGYVRSVAGSGPGLEVLSPDHMGWTSKASPTLYWRLSEATNLPIEIVITDDVSVEPLLETRLTGSQASGIHGLSLAGQGIELVPDTTYRWSVALVLDEENRSRDRFAGSALLYRPPGAVAAEALAAAGPGRLAHGYADQGYWYDAFDQFTLWLEAEPRDARLLEHRAALLEQVGIGAKPLSE